MSDFESIDTYPKTGKVLKVEVRMADGTTKSPAHFAQDLSGEEQPPFKGWFVPVTGDDGRFLYFGQIETPVAWRPLSSPSSQQKSRKIFGSSP